MELQSILTADYLDIIFDQRNKSYGGYELRKHYNRRAARAMFFVLSALLLALGTHSFASRFRSEQPTVTLKDRPYEISHVVIPEKVVPPIEIDPPVARLQAPSVVFVPPVIVDDNVEANTPTVEDLHDKQPATVENPGDEGGIIPATQTGPGTAPGTDIVETAVVVSTAPETWVEQMPVFDGDVSDYLGKHIQYPEIARETGTAGKVSIRFVVNEDGSVSDAKVVRGIGAGCEEEALRVVKKMPKWKPGKHNGKAMKVYMTLPVTFSLK